MGWIYTINEVRDGGPVVMWKNVSQEEVVREMDLSAKFRVGDAVQVGTWGARYIRRRKWNFIRGAFAYAVDGMRDGRDWWMEEHEIERRVEANKAAQT